MKKESNRKGTKHCPNCNKVVIKSQELKGEGPLEWRCPHCQRDLKAILTLETVIKITLITFAIIAIGVSAYFYGRGKVLNAIKGRCSDYKTKQEAQKAFDNGAYWLDGWDKDGLACEGNK